MGADESHRDGEQARKMVAPGTATAAGIFDLTSIKASRGAFGFPSGSPMGG
jgi:hypothetical protein